METSCQTCNQKETTTLIMNTLFYLFSTFALISGMMVIQSRNPVYSVLFLILVFFQCCWATYPFRFRLLCLDFFSCLRWSNCRTLPFRGDDAQYQTS